MEISKKDMKVLLKSQQGKLDAVLIPSSRKVPRSWKRKEWWKASRWYSERAFEI